MEETELEGVDSAKLFETLRAGGLVTGLILLVATWIVVRLVTAALDRLAERLVHRRPLIHQVSTVLRFVIYIGGIAGAVGVSINLSREVVLALTGTVAVTIGFALKDLAASILTGLTLLVDRPFQAGDRVKFEDYEGEIVSIGLRSVRLVTSDNYLVTIPNNKFQTEAVASANFGRLDMMVVLEFFINPDQDIAHAKRIVEECMASSRYVFLGKPPFVEVGQSVFEFGVVVRLIAKAHVLDIKYRTHYSSNVTERVLKAFRERRIALASEGGSAEDEREAA